MGEWSFPERNDIIIQGVENIRTIKVIKRPNVIFEQIAVLVLLW